MLVPFAEVDRAIAALEQDGWATRGSEALLAYAKHKCHDIPMTHPSSCLLELHFRLAAKHGVHIEATAVVRRAGRRPDEARWPVLDPVDEFTYLCSHAAGHAETLIWLYDLHLLARREPLDWQSVDLRAREWGVHMPVFYIAQQLKRRFGLAIPLRRPRLFGLREAAVQRIRSPVHAAHIRWLRAHERLTKTPRERARLLLASALMAPDPMVALSFVGDRVAREGRRWLYKRAPSRFPAHWAVDLTERT